LPNTNSGVLHLSYLLGLNCSAFHALIVPHMFRKVNAHSENGKPANR